MTSRFFSCINNLRPQHIYFEVWGIPCNEIGAEWAAQRIKGLDVIQVLKNAFLGGRER